MPDETDRPACFDPPPAPPSIPPNHERIRWLLGVIGWSYLDVAQRLGINANTVSQWCRGKKLIPNRVVVWLETVAAFHIALPLPVYWNRGSEVGRLRHGGGWDDFYNKLEASWDPPSVPAPDATPADPWAAEDVDTHAKG